MIYLGIVFGLVMRAAWAVSEISECPRLAPDASKEKSAGLLRPGDLRAVMAVGDDLLAALAARTLHTPLDSVAVQEYRGISFATGADPNAFSLHNFLQHFQQHMVGGSRGSHPVQLCPGGVLCSKHDAHSYIAPQQDKLNVALSGASSQSLGVQLKQLRRQCHKMNMTGEWKLLVVHVGTADLCQNCQASDTSGLGSGAHFEARLRSLMEGVKEHLPRTIVSVLLLSDVSQMMRYMKKNGRRCDLDARRIAKAQCPCALSNDDQARWSLSSMVTDFNERILKIAHEFNSVKGSDDFGIHVSAVLRDTLPHKHLPANFMSPLDCLHYTAAAHRSLAVRYWKSLFQPLRDQPQFLEFDQDVFCPDHIDRIKLHFEAADEVLEL